MTPEAQGIFVGGSMKYFYVDLLDGRRFQQQNFDGFLVALLNTKDPNFPNAGGVGFYVNGREQMCVFSAGTTPFEAALICKDEHIVRCAGRIDLENTSPIIPIFGHILGPKYRRTLINDIGSVSSLRWPTAGRSDLYIRSTLLQRLPEVFDYVS